MMNKSLHGKLLPININAMTSAVEFLYDAGLLKC